MHIHLPAERIMVDYSVIVKGKPWPEYAQGRYNVLPSNNKDIVVARNEDGTFYFSSTEADYDLSKYFESFEILETKN